MAGTVKDNAAMPAAMVLLIMIVSLRPCEQLILDVILDRLARLRSAQSRPLGGVVHRPYLSSFQRISISPRFLYFAQPSQYGPRGVEVRACRDRSQPRVSKA